MTTELEKWFPREASITAEILPPLSRLKELRLAFESTYECWSLKRIPIEQRTMRMGFSGWERIIIPIHLAFGDRTILEPKKDDEGKVYNPNTAIVGTALHEVLPLVELMETDKSEQTIFGSFPTSKRQFISPYVSALNSSGETNFSNVWAELQSQDRYIHKLKAGNQEWFWQEFPDELRAGVPTPTPTLEEMAVRNNPETTRQAELLSNHVRQELEQRTGENFSLFELGLINNFRRISNVLNTRIQIPIRYDQVVVRTTKKGKNYTEFRI